MGTPMRLLVMFVVAGSVTLAAAAGAADEPVNVVGRYVEHPRPEGGTSIGPLDLQLDLFHAGGVGPHGVPCTLERTEITFNRIALTFDFAAGTVNGDGRMVMSCEYHPGCGAVERVVEAEYGNGVFLPEAGAFYGDIRIRSLDGPSTLWGMTENGEGCAGTYITPGVERSGTWVLPLSGEAPATGYSGPIEVEPLHRSGVFELTLPDSLLATSKQDLAATFSATGPPSEGPPGNADGGGGEDPAESSPFSGDEGEGLGGLFLALALLLGVGAAFVFLRWLLGHSGERMRARAISREKQETASRQRADLQERANRMLEPGQKIWVPLHAPLPAGITPLPDHPHADDKWAPADVHSETRVIWNPERPEAATLTTGTEVVADGDFRLSHLPEEYRPTHYLAAPVVYELSGSPTQLSAGNQVQVLTTQGDKTRIRVHTSVSGTHVEAWVPRDSIGRPVSEDLADDLGRHEPAPPPPPPPPLPPPP